jgi:hypothetical protein
MVNKKKSQVWVETVIYTLIGLTIMGTLLFAANPQIEKIKDKGTIQQTIAALDEIDNKISETEQMGPGNIRIVDLKINKGRLEINSENNSIEYILENTRLKLSEPGMDINDSNLVIRTDNYGARFRITLKMDYNNSLNITYQGKEEKKILTPGANSYKIQMDNAELDATNPKTNIDFNIL